MNLIIRKILMVILGLAGALCAWGSMELLLLAGSRIGGYLVLSLSEGALLGLFFGFSFGTAEGILVSDRKRSIQGGLAGAATGAASGILVVLLIQGLLSALISSDIFTLKTAENLILPISRAVGWMILGAVVGAIEGIRSRSPNRVWIGVVGGLSGGFAGGAVLEFITTFMKSGFAARGTGFLIMGGSIGLFYSLFESVKAFGMLKVLTGPVRGKEYVLIMKKTVLGSDKKSAIDFEDYSGLKGSHALFVSTRDEVVLESLEGEVFINEEKTGKKRLQYEDVIQIGSVKLLFLPAR